MTKSPWDQFYSWLAPTQGKNHLPVRPFYYRWISLDGLYHLLYQLNLPPEDNQELMRSILETIHYEMLDATLSLIPEEEHDVLIDKIRVTDDMQELFGRYDLSVEVIETSIKRRGETLLEQIYQALTEPNPKL